MPTRDRERGASAVEFALVVPLLLILVLGIAEFGRAYNVQTTVSGAAREAVRVKALKNPTAAAITAAKNAAAPALALADGDIDVSPSSADCAPDSTVTVTITYRMPFISNFFGPSISLTGKGVMRCNG